MKSPDELVNMQARLDGDRAILQSARIYVANADFHLPYPETPSFFDASGSLVRLKTYRQNSIGWAENQPSRWNEFQHLQANESTYLDTVGRNLGEIANHVFNTGRAEDARNLYAMKKRIESIPFQERELYRAHRAWGRAILENTKRVFNIGAGNQIEDIARSGGWSNLIVENLVRNQKCRNGIPDDNTLKIGQDAAIAGHFGAGNCYEQNAWAATEAVREMPGTRVTLVADPVDHVYLVLGPPNSPEAAYVDAWPLAPTVANRANYGLRDTPQQWVEFSTVADGRDLRYEARDWLHPLPARPPRGPRLTLERAMKVADTQDNYVYHITRTTDDLNSDSETEDRRPYRFTLSHEAMEQAVNVPPVPGWSPAPVQSPQQSPPRTLGSPSMATAAAMFSGHPSAHRSANTRRAAAQDTQDNGAGVTIRNRSGGRR